MNTKKLKINQKHIFYIYLLSLIPIFIFIFDFFYLNKLNEFFKNQPYYFILYIYLFDFPHIIGSFLSYFDKDYIKEYKNKILKYFLIFVGIFFFFKFFLNEELLFVFFGFYTMYHVIGQEIGITKLFGNKIDFFDEVLKYLIMFITGYIFCQIYLNIKNIEFNIININFYVFLAIVIVLLIVFLKHLFISKKSFHYLMYCLILFICSVFYYFEYYFLTILTLRIIHDISAFYFYSIHNYNRKKESKKNVIFNFILFRSINPILLTIIIPISINYFYFIILEINFSIIFFIYLSMEFIHYNMEKLFWRRNKIGRRNIPF